MDNSKKISVARAINGISINGLAYLMDDKNDLIRFENEEEARSFLLAKSESEAALDNYTYEEV